jgi:hypothetical protein
VFECSHGYSAARLEMKPQARRAFSSPVSIGVHICCDDDEQNREQNYETAQAQGAQAHF